MLPTKFQFNKFPYRYWLPGQLVCYYTPIEEGQLTNESLKGSVKATIVNKNVKVSCTAAIEKRKYNEI